MTALRAREAVAIHRAPPAAPVAAARARLSSTLREYRPRTFQRGSGARGGVALPRRAYLSEQHFPAARAPCACWRALLARTTRARTGAGQHSEPAVELQPCPMRHWIESALGVQSVESPRFPCHPRPTIHPPHALFARPPCAYGGTRDIRPRSPVGAPRTGGEGAGAKGESAGIEAAE